MKSNNSKSASKTSSKTRSKTSSKKTARIASLILCVALMSAMFAQAASAASAPDPDPDPAPAPAAQEDAPIVALADELEGTYRWMVTGYDWGPAVNKIIIKLNDSFTAADFDESYFTVRAGTNANPTTNRPITAAYPSDMEGNRIGGPSIYITLDLQVAQNVGTPFTYTFTTGFNTWTANYQHAVILNKPLRDYDSWTLAPDTASGPFGRYTPEYNRFNHTQKEYSGINYHYAWFTPPEASATNKRPLIVWLHGAGEGGTDPSIILYGNKVVNLASDAIQGVFDGAFVLTPQARTAWLDRDGTGTYTTTGDSYYTESLMELIKDFVDSTPNIDKDRIYITGCSNGGFMTTRLLVDYPGYFAAGVPICPVFSQNATEFWLTPAQAETTKDTPIWFVQATNDSLVNFANNGSKVYNTLVDAGGGNLHFFAPTSVPYNTHWSWQFWLNNEAPCNADATAALRDCTGQCKPDVSAMEWLAAQALAPKAGFDLVVDVLEWGSATTAAIIDMGEDVEVDADDIGLDTFSVSAVTRNPTNNAVVYNGARTITDAYVSATNEKGAPAASGRYVVLELKYGFNNTAAEVNGSAAINYLSSRNYWLNQDYKITQEKAVGGVEGLNLVYNSTVTPIYDDFILTSNPVAPYTGQTYRVYTPKGASGPLPLVLWNHGAGETFGTSSGASNEGSQLFANMGGVGWVKNAPEDCVVIAPQRSLNGYSQAGVIAFIQDLIDKGVVDGDRVYVSGCSMGGQETDNFIIAYPSFFAAAMPTCPAGSVSVAQAATIAAGGVPVWIINAANDPTVNNASVATLYNNMIAGGVKAYRTMFADVRGTEIPNADYATATYNGHWSWVMLLNNIEDIGDENRGHFMDWLFAQSRTVTAGIETQAELNVDNSLDISYNVLLRREVAGTNLIVVTAAFDAAKLDYAGSAPSIPGWAFLGAPTVDAAAGSYSAIIWSPAAGAQSLFKSFDDAPILKLDFTAKPNLAYRDQLGVSLASVMVSEILDSGFVKTFGAALDPGSAAATVINYMRFDLNGNGAIDTNDLATVLYYYYLQTSVGCSFWETDLEVPLDGGGVLVLPPARFFDYNGDGIIDLADLLYIISYIE